MAGEHGRDGRAGQPDDGCQCLAPCTAPQHAHVCAVMFPIFLPPPLLLIPTPPPRGESSWMRYRFFLASVAKTSHLKENKKMASTSRLSCCTSKIGHSFTPRARRARTRGRMPRASALASLALFSSLAVPAAARFAGSSVGVQTPRYWLAFAGTGSSAAAGKPVALRPVDRVQSDSSGCFSWIPLAPAQPPPSGDVTKPVALRPVDRVHSDSSGCFSWIALPTAAAHPRPPASADAADT
jgi:hypothetical protein